MHRGASQGSPERLTAGHCRSLPFTANCRLPLPCLRKADRCLGRGHSVVAGQADLNTNHADHYWLAQKLTPTARLFLTPAIPLGRSGVKRFGNQPPGTAGLTATTQGWTVQRRHDGLGRGIDCVLSLAPNRISKSRSPMHGLQLLSARLGTCHASIISLRAATGLFFLEGIGMRRNLHNGHVMPCPLVKVLSRRTSSLLHPWPPSWQTCHSLALVSLAMPDPLQETKAEN